LALEKKAGQAAYGVAIGWYSVGPLALLGNKAPDAEPTENRKEPKIFHKSVHKHLFSVYIYEACRH
jgi:hypothetical protein